MEGESKVWSPSADSRWATPSSYDGVATSRAIGFGSNSLLVSLVFSERYNTLVIVDTGGAYAVDILSALFAGLVAFRPARSSSTWYTAKPLRTATPRPQLASESAARRSSLIGASEETNCGCSPAPARSSGTRRSFRLHPCRRRPCQSWIAVEGPSRQTQARGKAFQATAR